MAHFSLAIDSRAREAFPEVAQYLFQYTPRRLRYAIACKVQMRIQETRASSQAAVLLAVLGVHGPLNDTCASEPFTTCPKKPSSTCGIANILASQSLHKEPTFLAVTQAEPWSLCAAVAVTAFVAAL